VLALHPASTRYELPAQVTVHVVGKRDAWSTGLVVRRLRAFARNLDVVVAFQPYIGLPVRLARVKLPWLLVTVQDPRRWGDTSRRPAAVLRAAFAGARAAAAPAVDWSSVTGGSG
jgi:hypothetical protein